VKAEERWTNRSPSDLAAEVQAQGFQVGPDTMRRLLRDELGLSLRQSEKDEAARQFPERDEQFRYIAQLRDEYQRRGWPVLSLDAKQKEILGNFFHEGRAYTDGRVRVLDHDFVEAEDRLVPYGVYDTIHNEALMYLSRGADTSELACDAVWRWWMRCGRRRYKFPQRMLLLCDSGGSNGSRLHVFKEQVCRLAADLRMDLRVAHYPPGCSKYNPIEHRVFCHVSRSLRATVLDGIETARRFISRTTTATGLRVVAEISRLAYEKGRRATRAFMDHNPIQFDSFLPQLNYTAPWFQWLY